MYHIHQFVAVLPECLVWIILAQIIPQCKTNQTLPAIAFSTLAVCKSWPKKCSKLFVDFAISGSSSSGFPVLLVVNKWTILHDYNWHLESVKYKKILTLCYSLMQLEFISKFHWFIQIIFPFYSMVMRDRLVPLHRFADSQDTVWLTADDNLEAQRSWFLCVASHWDMPAHSCTDRGTELLLWD